MTNESGLTSTVPTTKCQYFFVNPVRLNYFLIARPPSLDDVRSLRPRFIPIQRRMKQHLMTLNWNGAEPPLWSYVARYQDCYVTTTRKCFNSVTKFFPYLSPEETHAVRSSNCTRLVLLHEAAARFVFVDTLDMGGCALCNGDETPTLSSLTGCSCATCTNEKVRQSWDVAIQRSCDSTDHREQGGNTDCADCVKVVKRVLAFDKLYIIYTPVGRVYFEGGGVRQFVLQRGTTGDTPAACTWISVSAPVVPATSLQPAVNEEPAVNVFEEVEF